METTEVCDRLPWSSVISISDRSTAYYDFVCSTGAYSTTTKFSEALFHLCNWWCTVHIGLIKFIHDLSDRSPAKMLHEHTKLTIFHFLGVNVQIILRLNGRLTSVGSARHIWTYILELMSSILNINKLVSKFLSLLVQDGLFPSSNFVSITENFSSEQSKSPHHNFRKINDFILLTLLSETRNIQLKSTVNLFVISRLGIQSQWMKLLESLGLWSYGEYLSIYCLQPQFLIQDSLSS